jgi:hypothetical protein
MSNLSGAAARFPAAMAQLFDEFRLSRHSFFRHLAMTPRDTICSPELLGEMYVRYQAAMHATRVMVYFLPHLNRPSLRIRKCAIYVDDDGLAGGDTHHHQLARCFRNLGAHLRLDDDDFGDLDTLIEQLDPCTARFVSLVHRLYPASLGPWCIVELLSDDWMHAFAETLGKHFPKVREEPYFADVFSHGVEERHGREAVAITIDVLSRKPELFDDTIAGATAMATAVQDFWTGMDEMLSAATAKELP